MRKPKFSVGQVVFSDGDDCYDKIVAMIFHPRDTQHQKGEWWSDNGWWYRTASGLALHESELRPLTKTEMTGRTPR